MFKDTHWHAEINSFRAGCQEEGRSSLVYVYALYILHQSIFLFKKLFQSRLLTFLKNYNISKIRIDPEFSHMIFFTRSCIFEEFKDHDLI